MANAGCVPEDTTKEPAVSPGSVGVFTDSVTAPVAPGAIVNADGLT
jgi:hypothetical protein